VNLIPPELGSEKFTRWANAVWPYTVGFFGMAIIALDVILLPPPGANATTSGIGCFLITGQGVIGLELHRRRLASE
jgi:uncharacterized membrane protein YdcZ (DUF606 family)